MERGTQSRSKRRKRKNGDPESTSPEPGADRDFVETSEIQFDFSNGDDAGAAGPDAGPEAPAQRDSRAARIDREIPAPDGRATLLPPTPPATKRPDESSGTLATDGPGTLTPREGGNGRPPAPPAPAPAPKLPPRRSRPRLKKLRMLFVLAGLSILALVSTVFGMMMAVSQDLPAIYNFAQFRAATNTVVFDDTGEPIGTLSSNQNKILLESGEISQYMKNATVAIEDSRFYQHGGVDYTGIARALVQDVLSRSAQQGASTITMQFVKNALEAQGSRTVFQKFREAALAYRLEEHWSKDKILTEYLNTVYFGEGAYGIEAAAQTYFGWNHPDCGGPNDRCASQLLPEEAAMLAGVISSPSAYDPKLHPLAADERRDLVLDRMHDQGYITDEQYEDGVRAAVPSPSYIEPPEIDSEAPYFTTWLRQQLVDKYGPGKAFFGGLKVRSTLDLSLQQAAEAAVYNRTAPVGITGSVVVINNDTGAVKAMVGGAGYEDQPFNIAAYGARQPGSAFKPFTLVSALSLGHSPYEVYSSQPKVFSFGTHGRQKFPVENYEDNYLGSASLISATQYSDNSVYAELGLSLKNTPKQSTTYIKNTARRMGISSPIGVNPAIVLGGLRTGVNTLEMAHAYETIAMDGNRISGTLAPDPGRDPVAFTRVYDREGHELDDNETIETRVLDEEVAATTRQMLANVVSGGTGTNAAGVSDVEWGKTGTTDDNGDAWFCGATESATACVWVGHADEVIPMTTEYGGLPVDGGTIPALIWHDVMTAWESIREELEAEREAAEEDDEESESETDSDPSYVPPSTDTESYSDPAPSTDDESSSSDTDSSSSAPAPEQSTPAPAPSGGGGVSTGGGISPG